MARHEIEQAVEAFLLASYPGQWPPLKPRECLHLDFRANAGLFAIAEIVRETPQGLVFKKQIIQNLDNFRSTVRWFFLEHWKTLGEPIVSAISDLWVKSARRKR